MTVAPGTVDCATAVGSVVPDVALGDGDRFAGVVEFAVAVGTNTGTVTVAGECVAVEDGTTVGTFVAVFMVAIVGCATVGVAVRTGVDVAGGGPSGVLAGGGGTGVRVAGGGGGAGVRVNGIV